MWIVCQTRPDIAYAVGKCSRYSANPTPDHDLAVKQINRYLAGTAQLGLRYGPSKMEGVGGAEFFGYTDSGLLGFSKIHLRLYVFPMEWTN